MKSLITKCFINLKDNKYIILFLIFNLNINISFCQSELSIFFKSGCDYFDKGNYKTAFSNFKKASKELNTEFKNKYKTTFKYYKNLSSEQLYNSSEIYLSFLRLLNSQYRRVENPQDIFDIILQAQERYPENYLFNIEESYYQLIYFGGEKAEKTLEVYNLNSETERVIDYRMHIDDQFLKNEYNPNKSADALYKIMHFNIATNFWKMSNDYHDKKKHEVAFKYMNKAILGYENAIKLDSTYFDAYYNIGVLYYNNALICKSITVDYSGDKYESEMKKSDNMLRKSIPFLEKVPKISINYKSTLKALKHLYFTLDDVENYSRIKKQLEIL